MGKKSNKGKYLWKVYFDGTFVSDKPEKFYADDLAELKEILEKEYGSISAGNISEVDEVKHEVTILVK